MLGENKIIKMYIVVCVAVYIDTNFQRCK